MSHNSSSKAQNKGDKARDRGDMTYMTLNTEKERENLHKHQERAYGSLFQGQKGASQAQSKEVIGEIEGIQAKIGARRVFPH